MPALRLSEAKPIAQCHAIHWDLNTAGETFKELYLPTNVSRLIWHVYYLCIPNTLDPEEKKNQIMQDVLSEV